MDGLRALSIAGLILAAGCAGPNRGARLAPSPEAGVGPMAGPATWNRSGAPREPRAESGQPDDLPAAAPVALEAGDLAQGSEAPGSIRPFVPERLSTNSPPHDPSRPDRGAGFATVLWDDSHSTDSLGPEVSEDDAIPMLPLVLNVELPAGDESSEPSVGLAGAMSEPASTENRLTSFEASAPRPLPFDTIPTAQLSRTAYSPLPRTRSRPRFRCAEASSRALEIDQAAPTRDFGRRITRQPLPGPIEAPRERMAPVTGAPLSQSGWNPSDALPVSSASGASVARIDPSLRPVWAEADEISETLPPQSRRDVAFSARRRQLPKAASDVQPRRCPTCETVPLGNPSASSVPTTTPSVFEAAGSPRATWRPHVLRRLRERAQTALSGSGRREPNDVTQGRN
jgi:hypothetical protein